MMKRILMLGLIGATLVGCQKEVKRVEEVRSYEITNINPPKRMYVDLYDAERDQFFPQTYVAKRCSSWQAVKSGSRIRLTLITSTYEDGTVYTRIWDAQKVCPR